MNALDVRNHALAGDASPAGRAAALRRLVREHGPQLRLVEAADDGQRIAPAIDREGMRLRPESDHEPGR